MVIEFYKKSIKYIFLTFVCFFFVCANCLNTESNWSGKIEQLCQRARELDRQEILDGEVIIAKGNDILLHLQSSFIKESALKSLPQFMIASNTKQFTAVALLKALYDTSIGATEEEKCAHVIKQLHEPIITYLTPDNFAWGPTIPSWAYQVTLHHLLTHTAGLFQEIRLICEREGFDAVQSFIRKPHIVSDLIQRFKDEPLQFTPGSAFCYSNIGYELLGEVITHITKMSFEQYLHTQFFEPLELTSIYNPTKGNSHNLKKDIRCSGLISEMIYDVVSKQDPYIPSEHTLPDIGSAQGAGSIISSAKDLLTWNSALHEKKSILPVPLYELFVKPNLNEHGYGIWNRNGILYYTGKFGAYTSVVAYIPESAISIIMLFHIDIDENVVHAELQRLQAELKKTITDEQELCDIINEKLKNHYCAYRGAAQLIKFFFDEIIN